MDSLRQWAAILCITLVGTGGFSMLMPNGSMEKIMKFALSLFFLTAVISPFASGQLKLDWDYKLQTETSNSGLEQTLTSQVQALTDTNLEAAVRKKLEEMGIIGTAEVESKVGEGNAYLLLHITITLPESCRIKSAQVQSMVTEQFGLEPEIIYE